MRYYYVDLTYLWWDLWLVARRPLDMDGGRVFGRFFEIGERWFLIGSFGFQVILYYVL